MLSLVRGHQELSGSKCKYEQPPRVMEMLYSFANGGSERIGSVLAIRLKQAGWPIEVCATHAAHGPIADWLDELGVPTYGLNVDGRSLFGRRHCIYKLLRNRRIDVLHVQHFSILALCYWPARLAGVRRIVVTEHAETLLKGARKTERMVARYASLADLVTVIYGGLRTCLIEEMKVAADRVHVIPNGVDHHRFQPAAKDPVVRRELGAQGNELLIGCVARLHAVKDHATLFQALAAVSSDTVGVRVALIGDGDERNNLTDLAHELGIEGQIRFLGDRNDVERLLPQFDLFVLPSQTEGVPLVLLEAMACGVACIATAVGGIPDLLDDDAGVLVSPQQPNELRQAIQQLLNDKDRRLELGRRARARVVSRYRMSDMVSSYATAFTAPALTSRT